MEVLKRVSKCIGKQAEDISAEPCLEINGYVIRFAVELESEGWNDQVVESIHLGQRIASGWSLTGNVRDDPGGYSSKVSDSAVEAIEWNFR